MNPIDPLTSAPRRRALAVGLAALWPLGALAARPAPAASSARGSEPSQHFPFGPVLPNRPVAVYPVRTHQGTATDLAAVFKGRTSAVQLMFTGCSATCPIQGALFAQAQVLLGTQAPEAQFVSLSIDPLSDTPAALARWLAGFQAGAGWLAASPRIEDVERLVGWLGSGGERRPDGSDPHTGQVFIVDRRGQLVFRTPSMPPAAGIVAALRRVAAQA